jgi:hypothetical protein
MASTIDGVIVLPLEVLVGDREHAVHLAHSHPAPVLDADQLLERHAPLLRIRKLEQQRHLPVAAARNQRVVGIEFVLDPRTLEDALGP